MYFRSGWLTPVTKATVLGLRGDRQEDHVKKKRNKSILAIPEWAKGQEQRLTAPAPGAKLAD